MLRFLLSIFVLFHLFSVHAQDHKDCFDALDISSLSEFVFADSMRGAGQDRRELDQSICSEGTTGSGFENNSFWLTWTIETAGNLAFKIIPQAEKDDLDFFLFRLKEENDCDSREEVRCMTSGDRFFPSPCMGETGLRFGEVDIIETPGCTGRDNNFLAPVDVNVGDQYILAITNFTSRENGFKIEFCGTAASPLTDTSSCPISPTEKTLSDQSKLIIFPNPSVQGEIKIILPFATSKKSSLEVYDLIGRQVSNVITQQLTSQEWMLDTSQLPSGSYFIIFKEVHKILSQKLVVMGF